MKPCANCGKPRLLVALHGDRGGPDVCMECSSDLIARVRRAQRRERDMFKSFRLIGDIRYALPTELDAELLRDALALTHPDRHPPERQEEATRVTQALTALQPHVLPRAVKPPPSNASPPGSSGKVREAVTEGPKEPAYPCDTCRSLWPSLYCDACRAEFKTRERQRKDEENARRRERRAKRREWQRRWVQCACGCGRSFAPTRRDQRYYEPACRQRVHRRRHRTTEDDVG